MYKYFAIVFFFLSTTAIAQPKGYSLVKNTAALQQAINANNTRIQTITSDFIQVKNMALLEEKIKSKGKFYYKKENKVRIEYTSPFTYLLVMNGNQIMVKDEQKTSKINTKNSKAMQSVNRIMVDCMSGAVFLNKDFNVIAYESNNGYLLSMQPATDSMKKMFKQIDVYMNKKTMDVERLSMTELGGDYTDMHFTNTKHNAPLDEVLFKAK